MNSKLQQAFNVVVRYGFCGDCKWSLGSQSCVGKDCYENCVRVIQDALDSINAEPVRHGTWIPVKWRELTDEEKEHEYGEVPVAMADFPTPDDGDEILITIGGRVMTTVYDTSDGYVGDEDWNDWLEDVTAWMPMPKPYKEDGAE